MGTVRAGLGARVIAWIYNWYRGWMAWGYTWVAALDRLGSALVEAAMQVAGYRKVTRLEKRRGQWRLR